MSDDQHQAARNLIEQLISNSDVHGEDQAEHARLQRAKEEEQGVEQDHEQHTEEQHERQLPEEEEYRRGDDAAEHDGAEEEDGDDGAYALYAPDGQIPDEVLAAWKELFSLFDFQSTGLIRTEDLGTVLRGLGHNVTEARVSELVNSYDAPGSGSMDFQTFYAMMREQGDSLPGPCTPAAALSHFAPFDMHREGALPAADLVHLLRNLGEPLTRDDVDALLCELYIDGDNKINLREMVAHMFRTSAPNPE